MKELKRLYFIWKEDEIDGSWLMYDTKESALPQLSPGETLYIAKLVEVGHVNKRYKFIPIKRKKK